MKKIILDLCGGTGAWSKPYADAGYEVINITLPDYDVTKTQLRDGGRLIAFFKKEEAPFARTIRASDIHGILAAPPCTQFSLARTTAKTPRDFQGAMEIVSSCLQIIWACRIHGNLKWWALENPRGFMRQFLGKPGYEFQAWWFGDLVKKPTDLWGYFKHPIKKRGAVKPQYPRKGPGSWANKSAGGSWQRSATPSHFAQAFFKSNP